MKKLLFAWMGLLLSGMNAVAAPTLTAITITPSRPTISVGQTQQFTATGMFSDGASRALIGGGGVWADKTPMSAPRYYYAVGVVNSTLYAVGGINGSGSYSATVEAYDPATNIWTPRASMFTPRYGHAVGVVNGTLYAVGGYNYNVSGSGSLATMEAYDPVTNTWTPKASMLTPREGLAVGVVNGILYAVGGYDYFSNTMFATVEAYDPVTDTWTPKASMPTPRAAFAVGVVNGTLYAVGGNGVGRSISPLSTVEAYDPVTNTWTAKAFMSTPRFSHAVGVVNGMLYAVGGYGSSNLATVEAYDPATNTWMPKTSMSAPRYGHAVGVVNGTLYAAGGTSVGGNVATAEAYSPPDGVIWSSNTPSVATMDAYGLVSGLNAGSSTITATLDGISDSTTLRVRRK